MTMTVEEYLLSERSEEQKNSIFRASHSCLSSTPASGRELPANARPPMTADEKTITSRAKKPHSLAYDGFGDFGVVG